jgi:MFS family permease
MMGWLSSAGSIARIIGPVFASYSFAYGGGRMVFASMMGLMFVVFLTLAGAYKTLRPRTTGQEAIN